MSTYAHLVVAFLDTARRVGAGGDVAGVGARLLASYGSPDRHYHDLRHLDEVLGHVDELAAHTVCPEQVRLAAWYHDAVYDPHRADNEEASARRAERELAGLSVADDVVGRVAGLVRLTATHDPLPGDADGETLSDADLAVLAADGARYLDYAHGVRSEYAHVPDAAFAAARAAVLRSLLARPRLYRTAAGADWEQRARDNVTAEIRRLEASGGAGRSR